MQIIVAQAPILPPDIIKTLVEENNQYREYWLQRKKDKENNTGVYYRYINSNGESTQRYFEEYLNGRWVYREEIPYDAFLKFAGKIKIIEN